jgi:DNA polymerase-3 subunit delta
MSIDILKKELKEKNIRNLYLFYGPEEYLKKYYMECIEKIVLTDGLKEMNRIVLEGKADFGRIKDNCETVPIFSERKIVIVKNSGLLKARKKNEGSSSKDKHSSDGFLSLLQNIPEYTCLVFYEEDVDKKLKTVEYIGKNGLVVEFSYQKTAELTRWVMKVFKSYKKEIDNTAAMYLVENSEQGMTEILNEINKVVAFLGDKNRVDIQDIESVCTKSLKGRIFDLTDAIAAREGLKALKLLDDMIVLKEPVQKIHFMIARQLRQIFQARLLLDKGMSTAEICTELGLSPYIANKILKQAKGFTGEQLKKALERSLELDVAVKTGRIDERMAVELVIVELSK